MRADALVEPGARRMSLAIVGPLPPPSGGMANQTLQLERLLREGGHAVEVVQVNAPYRPEWAGRVRGLRALVRAVPYVVRLWRCAGRVELFHVMANSGWAWHMFAAPAVWVARARGIPAIVNYRGGEAAAFMQKQHVWVTPSLRRASALVVPSAFLQQVFARWQVPARIVPNIVDLDRFAPAPALPMGVHCLVARNLEDIYDIGTALRAFALIRGSYPDARLTVVGSGPRAADLAALAARLGIGDATVFTGRIDNAAMAQLYCGANIVLNPSLADNMPNSLLEAMASGVPIVTTNVGGIPYMVEDGANALLVPPADPDAMARAVLRILADPALAARLRTAGLDAARMYTWPQVRARLFAVYADAVLSDPGVAEVRP